MILEISQPLALKDKTQFRWMNGEVKAQRVNRFAWGHRGSPRKNPDILNFAPAHSPTNLSRAAKDANSTVTRSEGSLLRVETWLHPAPTV